MLTTKRYEYLNTDRIATHPSIGNHRALNQAKVAHLEQDILKNGLLEPLVIWERTPGEYYLVGGFHRMAAIKGIRSKNPGYFERVDVRVVAGDPDEIKALNLKLNSDRLDTKITDYFETIIYLNNVNWSKERIAEFLDRSVSWVEEVIRYAPMVTDKMRALLETGEMSWNRAKEVIQRATKAMPGEEKEILEEGLAQPRIVRPLSFKSVLGHFSKVMQSGPKQSVTLDIEDLYSLLVVLHGKRFEPQHVERVKTLFPELLRKKTGAIGPGGSS